MLHLVGFSQISDTRLIQDFHLLKLRNPVIMCEFQKLPQNTRFKTKSWFEWRRRSNNIENYELNAQKVPGFIMAKQLPSCGHFGHSGIT